MTSRERVRRTLRFENPDRVPRCLWALPGVTHGRKEEYEAFLKRFPVDFAGPAARMGASSRARGESYKVGSYVDDWGSTWNVAQFGVVGEVKAPVLADWTALDSFQPPWEMIEGADFSKASASYAKTDGYVLGGTTIRPFERMQFLRGSENLYMDLAYLPKEVYKLRDMVHEFYLRELDLWKGVDADGLSFMDDWGRQNSLLISPKLWREFYKPLYADYCRIIHGQGKAVFFHSDGHIRSIYPDLIEIGVDAVNSQLFCMDIEELGRSFKGKVTFWGEMDRQHILPFGTPEQVREAVRRVRRALDDGKGGAIAQFEWGVKDPRENAEAVFETWDEPWPPRK